LAEWTEGETALSPQTLVIGDVHVVILNPTLSWIKYPSIRTGISSTVEIVRKVS
jgi:hypothetical protein